MAERKKSREKARRTERRATRASRTSAASGRAAGALRSSAAARGRRKQGEPMEAGPTASARRDAVAPLGSDEQTGPPGEPQHTPSPPAVAAEALRSGVVPHAIPPSPHDQAVPGDAAAIKAGDPDDDALRNEYVGEETPGGSTPTPDQSDVDEIGRAYGVQDEDSGELRTSTEIMEGRDRRRRGADTKRG